MTVFRRMRAAWSRRGRSSANSPWRLSISVVRMNVAEVMHIIGDVEGQHCLIVDDLIDTAGTLVKACEALLKQGAKSVRACATHAVLSGPAVERIENSELEEVIVTNSIPLPDQADDCKRIKPLSVAPLLAKAIQSIHEDGSVSTLFV